MRNYRLRLLLLLFIPLLLPSPQAGAVGETTLVSVATGGAEADDESTYPTISADGRYVAFESRATNLVTGDTNGMRDIFVRDLLTHKTRRVSVNSQGGQADPSCVDNGYIACTGDSTSPALSADGRYVAFASEASNLVAGDTNKGDDIFVHDQKTGKTTRVSIGSNREEALPSYCDEDGFCNGSSSPAISADGRYVAFESEATNLVAGDANGYQDIFIHDRETGKTSRVNVASDGTEADWNSFFPAISADGRYVAFVSSAGNLVAGDNNGYRDVFVHDRESGATTRVSGALSGAMPNGYSTSPAISADGRYVAFESTATSLVEEDANGQSDVFVHDRRTGKTSRVSTPPEATETDGWSASPAISADGRYVTFFSNSFPTHWVLIHDRKAGKTTRVVGLDSYYWQEVAISGDGRYMAYNNRDTYIRDRLLQRSVSADVTLTGADTPDSVQRGQELTYTFEVANQGGGQADRATLVDVLSSGLALTSVTPSQGRCNKAHVLICRLGSLAPGQNATVTVKARVRADAPAALGNTASAQAAPHDPVWGNNRRGFRTRVSP
jgi:uncharacterized repeat protein (TIGR01451 family)